MDLITEIFPFQKMRNYNMHTPMNFRFWSDKSYIIVWYSNLYKVSSNLIRIQNTFEFNWNPKQSRLRVQNRIFILMQWKNLNKFETFCIITPTKEGEQLEQIIITGLIFLMKSEKIKCYLQIIQSCVRL